LKNNFTTNQHQFPHRINFGPHSAPSDSSHTEDQDVGEIAVQAPNLFMLSEVDEEDLEGVENGEDEK